MSTRNVSAEFDEPEEETLGFLKLTNLSWYTGRRETIKKWKIKIQKNKFQKITKSFIFFFYF